MPTTRTPAQIEAARRNGALSRGPVTPEGKARSSQNALRHGLAALEHLLIEDEDTSAYQELLTDLVAEIEPETPIESHLVQRLASAMWKQRRADRLEQKLFQWAPTPQRYFGAKLATVEPEAAFDLARFATVQRYQVRLAREVSQTMAEIRRLRAERAAVDEVRNEPEPVVAEAVPNEPKPSPEPRPAGYAGRPNEPKPAPNRQQRRRLAALSRAA